MIDDNSNNPFSIINQSKKRDTSKDDKDYLTRQQAIKDAIDILQRKANSYGYEEEDEEGIDCDDDENGDYHHETSYEDMDHIAQIVMEELVALGKEDFVLLKDDAVREWWGKVRAAQVRKLKAKLARERKAQIKAEAYAKLSDEELAVLGLRRPK